MPQNNMDSFTLEFVSRECSECRSHLIGLYKAKPPLKNNKQPVIPAATLDENVLSWPDMRLSAREAMTRLHRIAVGCEEDVLAESMVAKMEGTFIINSTFRWVNFLLHLRRRCGFESAYGALFRLIGRIATLRRSAGHDSKYWDAVARWSDAPHETAELLAILRTQDRGGEDAEAEADA